MKTVIVYKAVAEALAVEHIPRYVSGAWLQSLEEGYVIYHLPIRVLRNTKGEEKYAAFDHSLHEWLECESEAAYV